jgi:DNA-binding NtrC family response regulator
LANVIERAAVLSDGPEITGEDLPLRIAITGMENTAEGLSYRHAVDAARAEIIQKALAHTNGNRAAPARILGMHKTHLLNLIKTLSIEFNPDSNPCE